MSYYVYICTSLHCFINMHPLSVSLAMRLVANHIQMTYMDKLFCLLESSLQVTSCLAYPMDGVVETLVLADVELEALDCDDVDVEE